MTIILSVILVFYAIGYLFSPFPYWRTYFILWKFTLFNRNKHVGVKARIKQVKFLLKYAVYAPLWTYLWYLDEVLYPQYRKNVVRPVFIIGSPRSGTTFLHRTLANSGKNFVAVRHLEWRYPFISFQKFIEKFNMAHKWFEEDYWPDNEVGRTAAKMHPNILSDWEEDAIFFEECFLHHFFLFFYFPYPELANYVDEFPGLPEKVQDRMLEAHKKVIQKVMFLHNATDKFYLAKEVASHNKMEKIQALYPDLRFIISIRKSSDFMNSLVELLRFSTNAKNDIDPMDIPGWKDTIMERMQRDCEHLTELCENSIDREKQVRVSFDTFTEHLVWSVEYIHKRLGLEIDDSYRDYLKNIQHKQKSRESGYTIERDKLEGFETFDAFVDKTHEHFEQLSAEYFGQQSKEIGAETSSQTSDEVK